MSEKTADEMMKELFEINEFGEIVRRAFNEGEPAPEFEIPTFTPPENQTTGTLEDSSPTVTQVSKAELHKLQEDLAER